MPESLDTNAKALTINRDAGAYGTFAEIGGGQEVSRWFFHVGGAAGTVAKTISAYDASISSALYGSSHRFVSPSRLSAILDREFPLLLEQIAPQHEQSTLFALADTVATLSHKGDHECHGWMGVRLQHGAGAEPSQVVLHISLRDATAAQQQSTLGALGVNLLYATLYQRRSRRELLKPLLDDLSLANAEIDVARFAGPAFQGFEDPEETAADLLTLGLARAVCFDDRGGMDQASTIVHKRPLILHRSSMKRENPHLHRALQSGVAALGAETHAADQPPLPVLELSLSTVLDEKHRAPDRAASRIRSLNRPGHAAIITTFGPTYELTNYLRRYSTEPIRFVVGLDLVVQMLREHFYRAIDGGMLEGLGRMLAADTRVYVFPMSASALRERLRLYDTQGDFCRFPDKPELSVMDLHLAPPAGRLLEYLREAGWLVPLSPRH
jgi:hypothetical protein